MFLAITLTFFFPIALPPLEISLGTHLPPLWGLGLLKLFLSKKYFNFFSIFFLSFSYFWDSITPQKPSILKKLRK